MVGAMAQIVFYLNCDRGCCETSSKHGPDSFCNFILGDFDRKGSVSCNRVISSEICDRKLVGDSDSDEYVRATEWQKKKKIYLYILMSNDKEEFLVFEHLVLSTFLLDL